MPNVRFLEFAFLAEVKTVGEREKRRVQLTVNSHSSKTMAMKLYVGGLSYGTSEETLRNTFSEAGAVETAVIIMDRMTGRSKGFGFVEMTNEEDAQKAIEMFNGKELEGRTLTVNEARPLEDRPKRSNSGSGYGGGKSNRW